MEMCFSYKKSNYSMNKKKSLLKWDREMEFVIVKKELQKDIPHPYIVIKKNLILDKLLDF